MSGSENAPASPTPTAAGHSERHARRTGQRRAGAPIKQKAPTIASGYLFERCTLDLPHAAVSHHRAVWISPEFSGARYCTETAITLAMTSADMSMNFISDFPRPSIWVKQSHSTLTAQLRRRSGKITAIGLFAEVGNPKTKDPAPRGQVVQQGIAWHR